MVSHRGEILPLQTVSMQQVYLLDMEVEDILLSLCHSELVLPVPTFFIVDHILVSEIRILTTILILLEHSEIQEMLSLVELFKFLAGLLLLVEYSLLMQQVSLHGSIHRLPPMSMQLESSLCLQVEDTSRSS